MTFWELGGQCVAVGRNGGPRGPMCLLWVLVHVVIELFLLLARWDCLTSLGEYRMGMADWAVLGG